MITLILLLTFSPIVRFRPLKVWNWVVCYYNFNVTITKMSPSCPLLFPQVSTFQDLYNLIFTNGDVFLKYMYTMIMRISKLKIILIFGYFCVNNHEEAIIGFVLFQPSINWSAASCLFPATLYFYLSDLQISGMWKCLSTFQRKLTTACNFPEGNREIYHE